MSVSVYAHILAFIFNIYMHKCRIEQSFESYVGVYLKASVVPKYSSLWLFHNLEIATDCCAFFHHAKQPYVIIGLTTEVYSQ